MTVLALLGFGVALFNYLAPLTGVTGTVGALVVVASSLLLTLCGLALLLRKRGTVRRGVRVLVLLGALGTLVAAWFLHEFWLLAAMVVVLLATLLDFRTARMGTR